MGPSTLTQFVVFSTSYTADEFVPRWQPIAIQFLRSGLRTITLATVTEVSAQNSSSVAFVSRNSWPAIAYRAAFPTGLAAEAAFGGITVTQPGVFHALTEKEPEEQSQPQRDLVLALVTVNGNSADDGRHATMLREGLTEAIEDTDDVIVYSRDASAGPQRVDLIVSVYSPEGAAHRTLDSVTQTLKRTVDAERVVLLVGREVLTLTRDGP